MDVPYLDEAAVAEVLRMEELIPSMRQAMIDYSAGRVAQPARRILNVEPHGGYFGSMTAVGTEAMGAKLVSFYPDNSSKGLETHLCPDFLFCDCIRFRNRGKVFRDPCLQVILHRDVKSRIPDLRQTNPLFADNVSSDNAGVMASVFPFGWFKTYLV